MKNLFVRAMAAPLAAFVLLSCTPQTPSESLQFDYLVHDWPHDISDIAPDPDIVYGALENGVRYAIRPHDRPENELALRMWIGAGSQHETDEILGLAHYLEHMAFNGSENVPEGEMVETLQRYGMSFGADTNASTSYSRTQYMLNLPEVSDELVDYALSLFRETADRLLIEPEAVDRERGVVKAEERRSDTPGRAASRAKQAWLYPDALVTKRSPIGTPETLGTIDAEGLRDFYQTWYRPDRAFIVAVGDIEPADMEARIAAMFESWNASGNNPADPSPGTITPRTIDAQVFVHPELTTDISLSHIKTTTQMSPGREAMTRRRVRSLANNILNRRLRKLATDGEAAIQGASIGYYSSELSDTALARAIPRQEDWAGAIGVMENEIRRAAQYGFSRAEMDEILAGWDRSFKDSVTNADKRYSSSIASGILSGFAGGYVYQHPGQSYEDYKLWRDSVSLEAVNAAFADMWGGFEPLIWLETPNDVQGDKDAVLAAWNAARAMDVNAPETVETLDFAYQDYGAPGAVVWQDEIEDLDITRIRFENGVRLNLKTTDFDDGKIYIRARVGDGFLAFPDDKPGLDRLAGYLALGGLEAHSADDISRIFAGQRVSSGVGIGTETLSMSAVTNPDDLDAQFQLWAAMLTAPGYRDEWLSRFRDSISASFHTIDSTPGGVAGRDMARILRSGNPRFGLQSEEVLLSYDLDDVRDVLEPSLNKGAIEIGIVGDFDKEGVITTVSKTLAALPVRAADFNDLTENMQITFPEKATEKRYHTGPANQARIHISWPLDASWDIDTARQMNVLDSVFADRLRARIREDAGLAYSPSAGSSFSRIYDPYGYLYASVDLDPKDKQLFLSTVRDIAADLRSGNISDDEFDRVITPIVENIETSLKSNSTWLGAVADAQTREADLDHMRGWIEAYKSISRDDIRALAQTQFDPASEHVVEILPEG